MYYQMSVEKTSYLREIIRRGTWFFVQYQEERGYGLKIWDISIAADLRDSIKWERRRYREGRT